MENTSRHKAEMDWNDLLKKPTKLFGYSYFYFIIILSMLGYLYISNLTNIGKNSIMPVVLSDSTAFIQDIPMQSPKVIQPIDVMKIGVSSPELVSKGKELFKANCSSCHGDNGQGDGPTALTLNPKPRNFHTLDGWKNGSKVTQIYKTLQEGIKGSAMASYSYLSPEDRFELIHFVRSFNSEHPADSPDELKLLDATYQLSKGLTVTGQIPVKKAMQLISTESANVSRWITEKEKKVSILDNKGARIFQRVVKDETKAFASLLHKQKSLTDLDDFIKLVSVDPIHAGFRVNVVQLSSDEWSAMYQFILSQIKEME